MGGLAGGGAAPDDFLAELARWSARDRVSRAAAERSRTRSLQEQSAGSATWSGLLLDMAEARADVTLSVEPGNKVSGRLVGVARDFVVVEARRSSPVLVSTSAITALAPAAQAPAAQPSSVRAPAVRRVAAGGAATETPGGRRRPALELTLAGALDALAAERAPVVVRAGTEPVAGAVVACGEDVVTIRTDGSPRPVYVPVSAVKWVELR